MSAAAGPELRDIHLPLAPGWWPPAPGWWVLAATCILCVIFALYKLHHRRRRSRARRAVLLELERCIAAAGADRVALAAALSLFLRRLTLRDQRPAAALHGERWLAYLDGRIGAHDFTHGVGQVLLDAPFRPAAEYDAPALIALVRRWARLTLEAHHA